MRALLGLATGLIFGIGPILFGMADRAKVRTSSASPGAGTRAAPRLVAGAAFLGIGWGIGRFRTGPALTSLALAAPGTLVFVPAMLGGLRLGIHARKAGLFSSNGKEFTA